jgi:hypothetical protein
MYYYIGNKKNSTGINTSEWDDREFITIVLKKYLYLNRDYNGLPEEVIQNILIELKEKLNYLISLAKQNNLNDLHPLRVRKYEVKSTGDIVFYDRLNSEQRILDDIDTYVMIFEYALKDNDSFCYYYLPSGGWTEKEYTGIMLDLRKNIEVKVSDLNKDYLKEWILLDLLTIENDKVYETLKSKKLFGYDWFDWNETD